VNLIDGRHSHNLHNLNFLVRHTKLQNVLQTDIHNNLEMTELVSVLHPCYLLHYNIHYIS